MLQTAWNKAVKGYQAARQSLDHVALEAVEQRIEEARAGYRVRYDSIAVSSMFVAVSRIPLSPAEAQEIIATESATRDRLQARMDARRQSYDLKS
ncbi:MAG: hypothetical protein KJ667_08455 [Alphaproteobacteria bacterium]|nr:hypothetical protein [Alphaproteobacteria bacterium]